MLKEARKKEEEERKKVKGKEKVKAVVEKDLKMRSPAVLTPFFKKLPANMA